MESMADFTPLDAFRADGSSLADGGFPSEELRWSASTQGASVGHAGEARGRPAAQRAGRPCPADDEAGVWLHPREGERLASLYSYKILDTAPESAYDSAARLAARACNTPAAMISLVDRDRQWFKAVHGIQGLAIETDRADSLCSDAVACESVLVIEDTLSVPRYARSSLVSGTPGIRAYAGVPLIGRDALPLGTLCVVDWRRRSFSASELEDLAALARSVVTHLELRRVDASLGRDAQCLLRDALDSLRLRNAIEAGEFVNHYQPIVQMPTGQTYALEALVRWRHPELGVIPPALFLPAMERTGLMQALGRSVLSGALDLAVELRSTPGIAKAPKVAVNVSGTQLGSHAFAANVAEELSSRSLTGQDLCIEVTESVPLLASEVADELDELRNLGIGVALDDYGTGNATARQILELPLSAIKLDRSLVSAVTVSERSKAIVVSTLKLAEELGLQVSCEGIETTAQRDFLLEAGATLGQGWLFSQAVERERIKSYLAHPKPGE